MGSLKIRDMSAIALMAAALCIVGPFAIPLVFTPVPISLTNLMVFIFACILGTKKGAISVILYLLIGCSGLPVFSGYSGGLSKLCGPTGGYLIGFIFCAFLTGIFVEKFENKIYMYGAGMIIGNIICYIFGTTWLAFQLHVGFVQGMFIGVIPYLIGDAIKIILASILGFTLRNKLKSLSLIKA